MDIGSRDGREALYFKQLCPSSTVVAFEANPYQFAKIKASELMSEAVIVKNAAVSARVGKAVFFIAKAEYSQAETANNNLGLSSLWRDEATTQEKIEVETTTVCSELGDLASDNCVCALWIDVEGAEAEVLKGLGARKKEVALIHVECATRPRWKEQESLGALSNILGASFINLGHNSTFWRGWGDAVFVNTEHFRTSWREVSQLQKEAERLWLKYIGKRCLMKLRIR